MRDGAGLTRKIVTIVGARPQFIKAAAVSRAIGTEPSLGLSEILVHTGQHFDENMSRVFFDELDIPPPGYNLEIAGGNHGAMTGRMLEAVEKVLLVERPHMVLIYGDTNSTVAGALAAAKLHIPIAHVEAGLRSFNMRMPEEINRVLADRISSLLLCPTATSIENLRAEGIVKGVHDVGDVMYDVALFHGARARQESEILSRLGLTAGNFILATCHRAENTDDPARLGGIIDGLAQLACTMPVVLPLHPRTGNLIEKFRFSDRVKNILMVEPLAYLDMIALEQAAKVICTDSGGVQKEAFFYGVPCVTMRDETEWAELVHAGWNQLAGADTGRILNAVKNAAIPGAREDFYGDGHAAKKVVAILASAAA